MSPRVSLRLQVVVKDLAVEVGTRVGRTMELMKIKGYQLEGGTDRVLD